MSTSISTTREWIAAQLGPLLWRRGLSRADLHLRRAGDGYRCELRGYSDCGETIALSETAPSPADALVCVTRRFARVRVPR